MKGISRRARTCAAVAGVAVLAASGTAQAQTRAEKTGDGIPTGQMGVQMFNYGTYISTGGSAGTPADVIKPAPATDGTQCFTSVASGANADPAQRLADCRANRLEGLFAFLQKKGLTNIEIFSHAGFPADSDVAGMTAYRALLDKYGLHAAGWHGTMTDVGAQWTTRVAAAKILGMESIGSGGVPSPGVGSYENTLRTAEAWNRLGKESLEAGVGPAYIHNHTGEFDAKYMDNGVLKTAWQILIERTDPRYAFAEVDVFWASDAFNDASGVQVANFLTANSTRIKMLHIKDGTNVTTQPSPTNSRGGSPQTTGTGEIDFRPIFAAAKNFVQYYHQEHDGGTIANADTSFTNLKGINTASVPAVLGYPTTFNSVAAGTAAAANAKDILIQNTGDKPLNITNTTITGDNAGDFSVVGSTCGRYPGVSTPASVTIANGVLATETAPATPRGTCTVRVGFKPTKSGSTSIASLTFTSDANDGTEKVLLVGKSNNDALGSATATVPTVLSLTLGAPANFGPFTPAVARNYDAASQATVVSTAGDATLSVSDADTAAPGRLVNGAFSLPTALQVRGNQAGNTGTAFASVSNTPATLFTLTNPTAGAESVTLSFRQAIGASDVLRAGTYSKTLTFSLSTTTP